MPIIHTIATIRRHSMSQILVRVHGEQGMSLRLGNMALTSAEKSLAMQNHIRLAGSLITRIQQ